MQKNISTYFEDPDREPTVEEKLQEYWFTIMGGWREVIPGDKKIGTIISIKQIHNDSEKPHLIRWNKEKLVALIQYQKSIYGELARQKITDIFVEGILDSQAWALTKWRWKMRKAIKKDPSFREDIFADYGWAFVYYLERDAVKLHPTESSKIIEEIKKLENNPLGSTISSQLSEDAREDFVLEQIRAFFGKNPWKKVALIYWSVHHFSDNITKIFWDEKRPREEIVSFPQIARKYIEAK
jgi:hypothetical protein